jgi:uncharacterized protein (DUF58 family)
MAESSFLTGNILHKIKQIEIHTRRLLRSALVGDSRSALKGTGFEFDQIRNYQFGDDVRFIDWNASARMNTLLVKQYIEERSRTILLAVDVSASNLLGSSNALKRDTIAQIASVLALVTSISKDRVGLLLFSQHVELYIPPARGQNHVHGIMKRVFEHRAERTRTNITTALKKLAQLKYKDALVFLISDFIDDAIDPAYVSCIAKRYDLIAIRCLDKREHTLPPIGFLPIQDSETGAQLIIDTRHASLQHVHRFLAERLVQQNKLFKRYGINLLEVENNDSFIGTIIRFFRRRMRY